MIAKMHELAIISQKVADGTATDADRQRLTTLSAEVAAATAPVDLGKLNLRLATMTFAAFKAHVAAVRAADPPDRVALALAADNVAAVQHQAPASEDALVAVRVLAAPAVPAAAPSVEERLKALEAKQASPMVPTGAPPAPPEATPAAKAPAPTAQALAQEAMQAALDRFTALQERIAAGETLTVEEIDKIWPSWELKNILTLATSILAKTAAIRAAAEVLPDLLAPAAAPPPDPAPAAAAPVGKNAGGWVAGRSMTTPLSPQEAYQRARTRPKATAQWGR